jgi:hydrogenase nickel incorporation protein HypB
MFRSADLILVNKADLLEHLDFDLEQFLGNLDAVNPGVRTVLTSARTGQGVDEWCDWLGQRLENV